MALRLRMRAFGTLRDESGLTTMGMVLSLLLTLALVFSSAQVYRVGSVSSRVQSVADSAALAAGNVVAEFMIAVRLCDAVALSLSLGSLTATGLGVVACCVPGAQAAGGKLIDAGQQLGKQRDSFSRKASEGLTRVQKALPFLSAAAAASVAAANGSDASSYVAVAVLVPDKADDIGVAGDTEAAGQVRDAVAGQADDIKRLANEAEQAAREANEAKRRAFEHDCGNRPGYCMWERADTLAQLDSYSNPVYSSVDTWQFSVALRRAQAYYPARLAVEAPEHEGVAAHARSELRKRFYAYAAEQLSQGYVVEGLDFRAYFPRLPGNTEEMRRTSLYTDSVYPCSFQDDGPVLHAWSGCPQASGSSATASIAAMEAGGWKTCEECEFTASSMGKVAAASSSIDNGFEYHYNKVAQAAQDYQEALARAEPAKREVQTRVSGIVEAIKDACAQIGACRIDACPPGSKGFVVLCANVGDDAPDKGFKSSFVQFTGQVGTRVAVSAATLVADPSGEGGNVISSLTDGLASSMPVGLAGAAADCWAALLGVYANGQESLTNAVRNGLDDLPLIGASGLGSWAADALSDAVEAVGLQPANLDALRPVVVNTAYVAAAGEDNAFCARLLELKRQAIAHPLMSNGVFSSIAAAVRRDVLTGIDSTDSIEIARVDIGGNSWAQPIEISLPPAAKEYAKGAVESVIDQLTALYGSVTGVRPWD